MMQNPTLIQNLLDFIQASPTPFHAVEEMARRLAAAGFQRLEEKQSWQLQKGQRYFVTRNNSSIIAFIYGEEDIATNGIRMVGAHTDSPCLKVKPNADIYQQGYWQLGVEVYGGVLLAPWFDRELALAGRVSFFDGNGSLQHRLLNIAEPVGMVPSLAIHLDREANNSRSINAQKDLPVVMGLYREEQKPVLREWLKTLMNTQNPAANVAKVLDYELSFYDAQPGRVYGVDDAFVADARLDNLLSCFIGLQALIDANTQQSCLLVCNDHEEVGSASAAGAQGPMLQHFLQRLLPDAETYARTISHSLMISVDNAHALHPNFADKHDANHGPALNAGPVIKTNANQRYASNSETQAIFRALCDANGIPVQSFVVRSDMACGSTIGPITASELGVRTLDVGVPQWAMHSIRETAGTADADYLYRALKAFNALTVV